MAREARTFEDFLAGADPAYRDQLTALDGHLTQRGCKRKVEAAKSGTRAVYAVGNRSLVNFVFRKTGLYARLYLDHVNAYLDAVDALPQAMQKEIQKAGDCKKLTIGPEACSPTCTRGYDFMLNGQRQQKCRFSSFFFLVNDQSLPFIDGFLDKELSAKGA